MVKVKREAAVEGKKLNHLMALAAERVELPKVPMSFDYQGDVDTLSIRFKSHVNPSMLEDIDEFAEGIIGIYEGTALIGVEILDITGQLASADPT